MTLSDELLDRIFDFLGDRDFNIDRPTWENFCRDHHVSEKELEVRKQELWRQFKLVSEDEARRKKLEQVFCCDPFDVEVAQLLRDLWLEKSESQLEPFREWAYGLVGHLLQISVNVTAAEKKSEFSPAAADPIVIAPTVEPNSKPPVGLVPKKSSAANNLLWLLIGIAVAGIGVNKFWGGNGGEVKPIVSGEADKNSHAMPNFPLNSCGDVNPGRVNNWYPVFVNYSDADLFLIRRDYCGDAYRTRRKDTGTMAIQVGSFTSRERAEAFAQVMSDRVGNAEVGAPTTH
jgi:hypothetical protein